MSSEDHYPPKVLLKIPTRPDGMKSGFSGSKSSKSKSKPKSKLTLSKTKSKSSSKGKPRPKPKPGGGGGGGGSVKSKPKGKSKPSGGGKGATPAPSTFKKKDDGLVDLEQQFLLRMPLGPAMALRNDVESGAMNLRDKLSIELGADYRHSFVRYGGQVFNARLVDLPCITETMKTTDRKTFFKTADICQMLICKDSDFSSDEEESPKKPNKDNKDNKYRWNHGITPPLKNVRKRRFRKTMKKKLYQDQPDIEKEVKRLFRMDNEAIDVKWEVVIEEDDSQAPGDEHVEKNVVLAHGDVFNPLNSSEAKKVENAAASENIKSFLEEDIFGDVSSSEEEEEDVDADVDPEINIMDSGEDEATPTKSRLNEDSMNDNNDSMMSSGKNENEDDSNTSFGIQQGAAAYEPKPELPQFSAKTDMFASFMSTDPTATTMSEDEIRERMSELSQHMQDLRDRRAQQEMELAMMDSSSLKDRLERELNNMIEEEDEKQKEYDSLSAMLGIPT